MNRAHTRRGQRRENRHRMNVALIQHAQHNVDRDDRRQNQPAFVRQRSLESLCRALKTAVHALRHSYLGLRLLQILHCLPQRNSIGHVE